VVFLEGEPLRLRPPGKGERKSKAPEDGVHWEQLLVPALEQAPMAGRRRWGRWGRQPQSQSAVDEVASPPSLKHQPHLQ
jgi:hypothetical protein